MINLILKFWNKQIFCAGKMNSIVSGDWSRRIDKEIDIRFQNHTDAAFYQKNRTFMWSYCVRSGTHGMIKIVFHMISLCDLEMNFNSSSHFHLVDVLSTERNVEISFGKLPLFQLNSFSIHFSLNIITIYAYGILQHSMCSMFGL